jgi:two-component sensor histidine kinase
MATLADLARERTDLVDADVDFLQSYVSEWSLLADLGFSDLTMWLPTWNEGGFIAGAQVRPTTGPTRQPQDVVGQFLAKGRNLLLDQSLVSMKSILKRQDLRPLIPQDSEVFPILREGRVIAIVERTSNIERRAEGTLERHYLEVFDLLMQMSIKLLFPQGAGVGKTSLPPRVGDGFLRIDLDGNVVFASPNAVSACHRLGLAFGIDGQHLANTLMRLTRSPGPADESLMLVAGGRAAGETEVSNGSAYTSLRSIPLVSDGKHCGAVVLLRDISELRRRENALLTKDATIREIHHRVKNNLQTVAALLRLQARGSDSEEVRSALEEAQRRVGAIATVHETLAHEPGTVINFDEVAQRLILMVRDMTRGMRQGSINLTGEFGMLKSEHATALAMALTELVSNGIEHGIGLRETDGALTVNAKRGETLVVTVEDDGPGLKGDLVEGLGLQIVRTIVTQDLHGSLDISARENEGVIARIEIPISLEI